MAVTPNNGNPGKNSDGKSDLDRLLEQVQADLAKNQQPADDTSARQERMKRTVAELQDSLDTLRLSVKYLVFDLEATRRENAYLRQLLDKKSGLSNEE